MGTERQPNFLSDLAYKGLGIAIGVGGAALFLAGAIIGLSIIGRLGAAGWIMYVVVIGCYALVFGPVLASAVTMYQRGSRRYREAVERRIEEQEEKFGLPTHNRHA
jgi:hypothetical protein